jgi:hypothetical protein
LHDQRQVEAVRQQVGDQVLGTALGDVQPDLRVGGPEGAQHLRHQRRAQAGRRAEPDVAAAQADQVLHRVPGGLRVGDHPASQRQQRLAGRGQRDVATDPLEQRRTERLLEGVNLLTQGGLGHTHQVGGLGEMPGFRDGQEVPELLELHVDSLRLWRAISSCIRRIVVGYLPSRLWQ